MSRGRGRLIDRHALKAGETGLDAMMFMHLSIGIVLAAEKSECYTARSTCNHPSRFTYQPVHLSTLH